MDAPKRINFIHTLSPKNSLHSTTVSSRELAALIQAALSPSSTNDERISLNIEIGNILSLDENYLSTLAEIPLLSDELASTPTKLAALSQFRLAFAHYRYTSTYIIGRILPTLLNAICTVSVPSILLALIDTFATALTKFSQSSYDILLAVCASTNSICGRVLKSRNVTPILTFTVEVHVNEPELSVRILQLIEAILEKFSVHHLVSEMRIGNNIDSFFCYMIDVMTYIGFHCKESPTFYSLMTHTLSIFILLIVSTRTIPQMTIDPIVTEILALISKILDDFQGTIQSNHFVGAASTLLTTAWRCLSHIFALYQITSTNSVDTARTLACKSILTDLSSIVVNTEITDVYAAMNTNFLNLLPKGSGEIFEAYIASPLSILQTMLNYGSMQTNDFVATSFFRDQAVSAVISHLLSYGCCIDKYDLHEWMMSPFNGSLLDLSGGKTNECCDFIAECFFGFQGLLIKDFLSAFTTSVTTFSSLTEESSDYFTVSLKLDNILAVFSAIWPSLTIDTEHHVVDRHVDKDHGTLFLFEDAYSIFDSLFRLCSMVLKRPLYRSSKVPQQAGLGNLIFLRRLLLLLTYVSASILPEFVDSCFRLLLCFLQSPMLIKELPKEEEGVIETYIGLQVLAANAISTIITDITSADQQREALLSSNHALNILFVGLDILTAVFADNSRLPSDSYLDVHTTLVGNLISFVNREQDAMKLEHSFFSSLVTSLGSLVEKASRFSNRMSAQHRLLNCYREALLIIVYAINLEPQTDLSVISEFFNSIYHVYTGTIIHLINSVLIDAVLEIIRVILNFLELCSSVDKSKECLEVTALVLFQLALTTSQLDGSRETVYTNTTITDLSITMIQLYPSYLITEGKAVTFNFLSYLFSFADSHADIDNFYQLFSILVESLADSDALARILYKDIQITGNLSRIHQFMDKYAYVPADTPLLKIESLMEMGLPISVTLIYLSFRCAYTSITAESHRSILLRAYCYAAPLIYATDTCITVLGNTEAFFTGLSDFIHNLLPCLSDALFNKRIATILQLFIVLDSYNGFQSSGIHALLNNCAPHLSVTMQQLKESNRNETDPTYTTIVRAIENLVDRRTKQQK